MYMYMYMYIQYMWDYFVMQTCTYCPQEMYCTCIHVGVYGYFHNFIARSQLVLFYINYHILHLLPASILLKNTTCTVVYTRQCKLQNYWKKSITADTVGLHVHHAHVHRRTLTALNPPISSFQIEGFRRIEVTRDTCMYEVAEDLHVEGLRLYETFVPGG